MEARWGPKKRMVQVVFNLIEKVGGWRGASLVTLILRNLLTAQHLDNVLSSIFEKKVTLNIKKKTKKWPKSGKRLSWVLWGTMPPPPSPHHLKGKLPKQFWNEWERIQIKWMPELIKYYFSLHGKLVQNLKKNLVYQKWLRNLREGPVLLPIHVQKHPKKTPTILCDFPYADPR